ncbi:tRNA-(ms[2]io[6]A)-hydroxylase [Legionella worsleiensis]|nr:tRNA-(ms[2]io[6]A)-hydroxylase [Legionella worsleiensis]
MLKRLETDLQTLNEFLRVSTPDAWLAHAADNIPLLLIDHAHCERKAAATAITFMSKYPEKTELVAKMSPLAREELLHFEKVLDIMRQKGISYTALQPSEYAAKLHKLITQRDGNERLCDQLIVGAIIEARSCERFNAIIPCLNDPELGRFYKTLIKSEARHFQDYLYLARLYGGAIETRLERFLSVENEFILGQDRVFRFHSGIPSMN